MFNIKACISNVFQIGLTSRTLILKRLISYFNILEPIEPIYVYYIGSIGPSKKKEKRTYKKHEK